MIEGSEVRQRALPDKRVFRLTEAGEQALDAWLADGQDAEPQFRLPFLLKVLFGHRTAPGDTAGLLEGVHGRAQDQAAQYADYLKLLEGTPDSGYAQVTVLFGLRVAEAIAAWAQEAQGMLPEDAPRLDPRREPGTTAALLRSAPPVRPPGT